jgi:hypothetical protein
MQLHFWPRFRFHLSIQRLIMLINELAINWMRSYNFPFHLIQFLIRKKISFKKFETRWMGEALKSFFLNCAFLYEWQLWTICVCGASNYLVIVLCSVLRIHNMNMRRDFVMTGKCDWVCLKARFTSLYCCIMDNSRD